MASPPPPLRLRPRSPPGLMEKLIEEILLRLPPEEPAYLFRAALVCRAWRRLSDGGFPRRYREFHGTPPLLGFLHTSNDYRSRFAPTSSTPSPLSMLELSSSDTSKVHDCRHGRVLVTDARNPPTVLVVWDPITGDRKHLVVPLRDQNQTTFSYALAVLCAVDGGCDHLSCHDGPFRVVLIEGHRPHISNGAHVARARVYSSATDTWSAASTSLVLDYFATLTRTSLLLGDALYFALRDGGVLRYDLGSHGLSMIDSPGVPGAIPIKAEDGGLGFVAMSENCVYLISREAAGGRWAWHRDMDPIYVAPRASHYPHEVCAYVEGTNTVFVRTLDAGLFTVDLKSRQVRKVDGRLERREYCFIVPYTSFYTPELAKGRLSTP